VKAEVVPAVVLQRQEESGVRRKAGGGVRAGRRQERRRQRASRLQGATECAEMLWQQQRGGAARWRMSGARRPAERRVLNNNSDIASSRSPFQRSRSRR